MSERLTTGGWRLAVGAALILWVGTGVDAQIGGRPTRPQVKPPQGQVRQIIFKNCTSCHGIDDYAFNALDRDGWNRHLEAKHKDGFAKLIGDSDRAVLLDWLVGRFGPETKPFPRTYVAQEINTFFTDNEGEALLNRACTMCHPVDRVNAARNSADAWRVLTIDMRERGAKISDEEVEKLVEWLGRTKGTNANQ
jgi:mono/diheme cytochrome c family protein